MDLKSLPQSKPAQRPALAVWYRSVLELAAEGGVSIAEVPQQMGCSAAVLYAWRRKLGLDVDRAAKQPSDPQPIGFLRLKMAPTDRTGTEVRFEVRCRGGRANLVPADYDSESLRGLIEVVEAC
jgi:transposase-like protein